MARRTKKSIEDTYKTLTPVEHVILRPTMYVGSTEDALHDTWHFDGDKIKMVSEIVNPALIKIFDEILSNSVDEHKRPGSTLNTIKVNIDVETGQISIWDNGGIPVVIHKDTNQYVPEMIFSNLRTGSNFDDSDDREGVGTNGVGSTLSNIFSTKFRVSTCDGKNKFLQTFSNNMSKIGDPKISKSTSRHTEITFTPDFEMLNTSLHETNYKEMERKVYDVAGCNPNIKVYLNGKIIKIKSFKDYISMFDEEFIYEENEDWKVGVGKTTGGFQQVSFVNGAITSDNYSTHVKYILEQIDVKLREFFKKKHKVDVKPSDIKAHLRLYIDAKIINPKYQSQTKDKLITEYKNFKTSIKLSDKFIKNLLKSDIIQRILDWVEAKKKAAESAKLRKLKKGSKERVDGYLAPTHENEYIVFCEGLSALGGLTQALSRKNCGFFALRGKPKNVWEDPIGKIIENKEIKSMVNITDMDLSKPDSTDMCFENILIATDMDLDGIAIKCLLTAFMCRFAPNIVKCGRLKYLKTPLIIAFKGDKVYRYFFTLGEYQKFQNTTSVKGITYNYYKGLGTHDKSILKKIFDDEGLDNFIETIEWDDDAIENLDFWMKKSNADLRKEPLKEMSFNIDNL